MRFVFQTGVGIRYFLLSHGLGNVCKRQAWHTAEQPYGMAQCRATLWHGTVPSNLVAWHLSVIDM